MLHNPTQSDNRIKAKRNKHKKPTFPCDCCVMNALSCTSHVRLHSSPSHWPGLRLLAWEADPSASALTCMNAIRHGCVWGVCDGLFSALRLYSNTGRHEQVPGIHFIWMGTIRIMMINIANPPVCFVPGIRIAELIHWSFLWRFGESVRQNTEFILGSTGHCMQVVCCVRYVFF